MNIELPEGARITEVTYTTLPDDDVDSTVWQVKAEWRGPGDRWAITQLGYCLSVRGKWDHEPSPSNRTEHFKLHHRFSFQEAIDRLPAALDTVVINSLRLVDGHLVHTETGERVR
jgi:hypothetical protein